MDLQPDDHSLVVDVGDLEWKSRDLTVAIDTLLNIAPTPENRDTMATAVADLWALIGTMKQTCDDLAEPLNHLIAALRDDGCADDGDNGDHDS